MSNNFLEQVASTLSQGATVKNVFGEPVQAGNKVIIPVARIAYGFGGGFGKGKKPDSKQENVEGEGGGGGGGLSASAKGVYEISPAGVKFIPAAPGRFVLIGVVLGFLLQSLLSSKRKCGVRPTTQSHFANR